MRTTSARGRLADGSSGLDAVNEIPEAANILINAGLDAVPVVGDALSIFFRSNTRNVELLRKHAGTGRAASRGDWIFLCALLGGVALIVVGCFVGLFYLGMKIAAGVQ